MIYITDYVDNPDIELEVIGNKLCSFKDKSIEHSKITVLLVWHLEINKDILDKFPNLKAIVRYGVGFDNIDLEFCKNNSIKVFNNPDYGVDEVSDTALAMIMCLSRCIISYNSRSIDLLKDPKKDKPWQENTNNSAMRLKSATLGVVGVGRIGSSLALKMKNIVGNICFFDPDVATGYEKVLGAERYDSLDQLLINSDIVSMHAPLSLSTKGIIDDSFVEKMKHGSILVNTARGGILKSHACLYKGLLSGKLAGVGLDVLPAEPPVLSSEDKLLTSLVENSQNFEGRIIINPHTAYFSIESYNEMRQKAALSALNALSNNQLSNRIV